MSRFFVAKLSIAAVLSVPALTEGHDWPQWQGPDRDAISKETGLLQEWPEGGAPLAWRINGLAAATARRRSRRASSLA